MNKTQLQSQIKVAADTIEAQAAEIESLRAKVAGHQAEAAKQATAKTASVKADALVKEAAAKIAPSAKLAADKLLSRGMLSSEEQRDRFAAKIAGDHLQAIDALVKAADFVQTAQKVGSVVEATNSVETADDVWNKHAGAALSRIPGAKR